mgnify:CR=1 FL=1
MRKEVLLGAIAMFTALAAISFLPYAARTLTGLAAQTAIGFLISAFIGSVVARRNFMVPATIIWAAIWCFTLYFALRIAKPAGGDMASVISSNWTSVLLSLAAVVAGALLGQFAASRRTPGRDRAMT